MRIPSEKDNFWGGMEFALAGGALRGAPWRRAALCEVSGMDATRWGWADRSDWGCDMGGRDRMRRAVSRRGFMKNGALALFGTGVIPAFLTRSVMAERTTAAANGKRLVVLF